ncbi:hypothetical protein Bbelb_024400 [Branchiostoma belcheri]|nr:hypothetical protein Bbelb_024400 [Branchiostoma belcheri]
MAPGPPQGSSHRQDTRRVGPEHSHTGREVVGREGKIRFLISSSTHLTYDQAWPAETHKVVRRRRSASGRAAKLRSRLGRGLCCAGALRHLEVPVYERVLTYSNDRHDDMKKKKLFKWLYQGWK